MRALRMCTFEPYAACRAEEGHDEVGVVDAPAGVLRTPGQVVDGPDSAWSGSTSQLSISTFISGMLVVAVEVVFEDLPRLAALVAGERVDGVPPVVARRRRRGLLPASSAMIALQSKAVSVGRGHWESTAVGVWLAPVSKSPGTVPRPSRKIFPSIFTRESCWPSMSLVIVVLRFFCRSLKSLTCFTYTSEMDPAEALILPTMWCRPSPFVLAEVRRSATARGTDKYRCRRC